MVEVVMVEVVLVGLKNATPSVARLSRVPLLMRLGQAFSVFFGSTDEATRF